jgi:hypothetical protein
VPMRAATVIWINVQSRSKVRPPEVAAPHAHAESPEQFRPSQ